MAESPSQTGETKKSKPPRGRQWLLIISVWLLLSLIVTMQRLLMARNTAEEVQLGLQLVLNLLFWSFWALAAPLVFALARNLPLRRPNWLRVTLAHFGLAIGFGAGHLLFLATLFTLIAPFRTDTPFPFWREFARLGQVLFYVELLFYWALLGAGLAQDSYRKYREREAHARALEEQLTRARLQALKRQLQPHFLFNALNTIAMLVRNQENAEAVQMIAGLGDLLRHSLQDGSGQERALGDELDFVRRYLEVEQFRFADRLRIEIAVPEDCLPVSVPHLILQPLVENAIRHGIAESSSASVVCIRARRENGYLHLSVQDDGLGLSDDWQSRAGIGLANTRERLAQLYGEQQELTIRNVEPTGVQVHLRIPLARRTETR